MNESKTPRHVMVRYKLQPDRVAENEEKIRAVFSALDELRPEGFRYSVFKLPDGVSFVHMATTRDPTILGKLPAFQAFTRDIADRCEEAPAQTELTQVAGFGP